MAVRGVLAIFDDLEGGPDHSRLRHPTAVRSLRHLQSCKRWSLIGTRPTQNKRSIADGHNSTLANIQSDCINLAEPLCGL